MGAVCLLIFEPRQRLEWCGAVLPNCTPAVSLAVAATPRPVVCTVSGRPCERTVFALDVDGGSRRQTWQMSFRTVSRSLRAACGWPAKRGVTGTRVRYWADPQIFLPTARFEPEALVARARQTAFLVPGLGIEITDERPESLSEAGTPAVHEFRYEGGISEFVNFLSVDGPVTDTWRITDTGKFTETVPVMDEATGHLVSREVERECEVDIAMRWGTGYDTEVQSFVNIIATPKGGTHLTGFEQGLNEISRRKTTFSRASTAVVTVRVPEPQFEGQTKEVLGTAAVRQIVSQAVARALAARFESTKKHDRAQAMALLEKMVSEMKSRIAMRTQRDTARRKSSLESSSLPAKLIDCRSKDVANSELFIVEGDSALGTARPARDSEYQALLPIRGKILNVQKASLAEMLSNTECAADY
ncbi:hypothetical protein FQR65_LT20988 [Abscondita terminalis]|nr:hypothetical protein FQR65_LT20988 [Abscondita terminalis]